MKKMYTLPHPIQRSLHILPWWISVILVVLLICLLMLLIYRYRKKIIDVISMLKTKNQSNNSSDTSRPVSTIKSFKDKVRAVKDKTLTDHNYRLGLFHIAHLARLHFENRSGIALTCLSASEIEQVFLSNEPSHFFKDLEQLQFSSHNISRNQFNLVCKDVVRISNIKIKQRLD